MTEDQIERLIAAVERMAATGEENLKLHREADTPPEMMRMIEVSRRPLQA